MVVLYSHLFVGASGCPGGVGALRMFLRRLARSYGPLLGSNCGVDFVDAGAPSARTRALGLRASSLAARIRGVAGRPGTTHGASVALQLKGPRRVAAAEGTSHRRD